MADFNFQQSAPTIQELLNSIPDKATKEELEQLRELYEALTQSEIIPVASSDWPVSDPQQNVIYRVAGDESYTDYMWNGTQFVAIATYDNTHTDIPVVGSTDVITAGGVANHGSAFDISEYNKSNSTLATYADLATALAAVPTTVQKGGMSIKFVQTSDNKYVQYRLTSPSFNTNVFNWVTDNDAVKPDYTELDGLLNNVGSIVSGTRFYHTSPIEVKIGQSLFVKNAIQVNSSISSIALVQEDGTFIMPIYQHGIYGKWDYLFTPVKDCHVSVSYYTPSDGDNNTIGIVNSNDNYEKKLTTLKSWLITEAFTVRNGTVVRDADGNVSSADVYYPDMTFGHITAIRDGNYNVVQLLFIYLDEDMQVNITRDSDGCVTGTSITI